jgi:glycosyltransferase involved in cell wall biosynthesis
MLCEVAAANAVPSGKTATFSRELRVLMVTHYYSSKGGGVESIAHQLSRRFIAEGCDVRWAAISIGGQDPTDIPIEPLRGSNLIESIFNIPFPLLSPISLKRLREAVLWADIVHLHDPLQTTSQAAALLARLHRRPMIVTQHVGTVPYRSALLSRAMRLGNQLVGRRILARASYAVFTSDVVRRSMKLPSDFRFSRLIYTGVDKNVFNLGAAGRGEIRRRLGLSSHQKIVLFVGRFVEKKGLHKLRPLVEAIRSVQWLFVGRGCLDPRKWQASNVRVFDQMQSDKLADFYRAADLLVLPSVGEGLPLVVQEALACGLPCLVSEEIRQACPDAACLLISAGPNGETITPPLTRTLESYDFSDAGRAQRSAQAHSLWSWEECAASYLEASHSCCRLN